MSEEDLGRESPAHIKNFEEAKLASHEAVDRIFEDYEMHERWYDNYGLTSPIEIVHVEIRIESEDGDDYDAETESIMLSERSNAPISTRAVKETNLIEILADL